MGLKTDVRNNSGDIGMKLRKMKGGGEGLILGEKKSFRNCYKKCKNNPFRYTSREVLIVNTDFINLIKK